MRRRCTIVAPWSLIDENSLFEKSPGSLFGEPVDLCEEGAKRQDAVLMRSTGCPLTWRRDLRLSSGNSICPMQLPSSEASVCRNGNGIAGLQMEPPQMAEILQFHFYRAVQIK